MIPLLKRGDVIRYLSSHRDGVKNTYVGTYSINGKLYWLSLKRSRELADALARFGINSCELNNGPVTVTDRIKELSVGLPKFKEGDALVYKGSDEKDGRILLINNVKHVFDYKQAVVLAIILNREFENVVLDCDVTIVLKKIDTSWMEAYENL